MILNFVDCWLIDLIHHYAMSNYRDAIEILHKIKTTEKEQFTFLMQNDLANAHTQSASIYLYHEFFPEAQNEYILAINILEGMQTILGKQFTVSMTRNLVDTYLGYANFYEKSQIDFKNNFDQGDIKEENIQICKQSYIVLMNKVLDIQNLNSENIKKDL